MTERTRADRATDFGQTTLPYCSFVIDGEQHVGVGIGTQVLDLTSASVEIVPDHAALFADGRLDALLAAGPDVWHLVRESLLAHTPTDHLHDDVELVLPFTVADYVDFFASEHHATNVGKIFRPDGDALTPNWKHLPIGYHGRAGTVVVSGTSIVRPSGQRRTTDGEITFGPSVKLDIEAELGYVVGGATSMGERISVDEAGEHLFGVVLLNDWSARDIQAWEYVPLGPYLGKSFCTSISAWVTPMAALQSARVDLPRDEADPEVLPYLRGTGTGVQGSGGAAFGLDVHLEVRLNGEVVSRPEYRDMYWSPAQMLAHMTVNGASLRDGDLFGSGTISGWLNSVRHAAGSDPESGPLT